MDKLRNKLARLLPLMERNPADKLLRAFSPNGKHKTHLPHPSSLKTIEMHKTKLTVVTHPDENTTQFLEKNYRFHPIHLEDVISHIQRPKIDPEDDYLFLVLQFPEYNRKTGKLESREIDFFLTRHEVIAVSRAHFAPFEDFVKKLDEDEILKKECFSKGAGFLLYFFIDSMIDAIFPIVEKIDKTLEEIDRKVFTQDPKNIVEKISFLRRNVIFFQTMIKPALNSFLKLEETRHYLLSEELATYFTNITDHLKKIWDRLEDVKELSDNLSKTFESYFSFKTNETIKVLTIFSVVLMPLNLLAGIYGMNLSVLPFSEQPNALIIIGGIMMAIIGAMIAVFKLEKWI